jgi:hypothetical protein
MRPPFCLCVPSSQRLKAGIVEPEDIFVLGKGSVNTFPLQGIHTEQRKSCLTRRFLCCPYRIKYQYVVNVR